MQLETLWSVSTARRVRAETETVGWRRAEVRALAERERAGDAAGNVRVKSSVSLEQILGAGFKVGKLS